MTRKASLAAPYFWKDVGVQCHDFPLPERETSLSAEVQGWQTVHPSLSSLVHPINTYMYLFNTLLYIRFITSCVHEYWNWYQTASFKGSISPILLIASKKCWKATWLVTRNGSRGGVSVTRRSTERMRIRQKDRVEGNMCAIIDPNVISDICACCLPLIDFGSPGGNYRRNV